MSTTTDPNAILATLYTIIIVTTFFIFWQRRRFYKLSRQFPGPVELPFIGVFHRMPSPRALLPKLKMVIEVYQTPTIFTYFGPMPALYTTDPNLLEKIFVSPDLYNKPDILYGPLSNLFGDGLFSSKAPKWNHHRKLINPAFRLPVLRTFFPIFNRNSKDLQAKLEQLTGKGELDISGVLQKLTLTAAVETVLGRKMESGTEVNEKIVNHYTSVMKSTLLMVMLNVLKLSGLAKHLSFYKSQKSVFSFVDELLKDRMNSIKSANNNNNDEAKKTHTDDLYLNESRLIFIDQAFKNYERQQFKWQDVVDESNSIIFAAFETTASAMQFTLTFLAMYPEVQEKLFDEIKNVFPDKEFSVEYEQLEDCVYLDMVINETLRLAPTVPTIARGVAKDTQLTDEIMLPKDLVVLVNIFQVHRNPSIWGPNADRFNPDNFLPENVKARHLYGYIPFSKGIRNCIGGRYALLAIKIVLLHTLRNYRFSTTFQYKDLDFINYVTLKCEKWPYLEVHKREN